MKHLFLLLCLITFLASCEKDTPRFKYEESPDVTKYVIYHSDNRISSYSKFLNDVLQYRVSYLFQDTVITRTTKNSSDELISKVIYFIGDNGYAESSIDSGFNDVGLWYLADRTFEYDNEFLKWTIIHYKIFGTDPDSGLVTLTNIISEDNIISTNEAHENFSTGCTDEFDYDENANVIDIRSFSNGITGRISKNLISHATWNYGCPAGPSMSIASSDFEYEHNSNWYISAMKETYTPSYHMGFTEEVTITTSTTIYMYY